MTIEGMRRMRRLSGRGVYLARNTERIKTRLTILLYKNTLQVLTQLALHCIKNGSKRTWHSPVWERKQEAFNFTSKHTYTYDHSMHGCLSNKWKIFYNFKAIKTRTLQKTKSKHDLLENIILILCFYIEINNAIFLNTPNCPKKR